jgi:hypothetical protein
LNREKNEALFLRKARDFHWLEMRLNAEIAEKAEGILFL